jgi:hypothetical protein
MMKKLDFERREGIRLRIHYPMRYVFKERKRETILEDISRKGMRILSNLPVEKGTRVKIEVRLPSNGKKEERWELINAKIVWVKHLSPQYNLYQAGVEFEEEKEELVKRLTR